MRFLLLLFILCQSQLAISSAKGPGKSLSHMTLLRDSPLSECLCREFPQKVRDKFHSQIIKDISVRFNSLKNSSKPLVITSYSSGKLLREYLIARDLNQLGFKNIQINAIDPIYLEVENQLIKEFINLIGDGYLKADYFFNTEYYSELVLDESEPEVMKADIILDIDSYCCRSTKEFDYLVSRLMNPDGRSYSLRQEMISTSVFPVHTGFILDKNLLSTPLKGFSNTPTYKDAFDAQLDRLPPKVRKIIFDFLIPHSSPSLVH